MTDQLAPNDTPIKNKHAAALAAGARALRAEARKYAPEAHLYESGIHRPYLKNSFTAYTRMMRQATVLDELAGHTNKNNQARKAAQAGA